MFGFQRYALGVSRSAFSLLFHQKSAILPKIPLFCRINSHLIMNSLMKKIVPHAIAFGVFLIVAVVYCKPALEGKVLTQSDVMEHKGMAQQSEEFKAKYGHYPLWTESAFGGMPTYTIQLRSSSTILNWIAFLFSNTGITNQFMVERVVVAGFCLCYV